MYANDQMLFNLVFVLRYTVWTVLCNSICRRLKGDFHVLSFIYLRFRNMSCGCYELVYCTEKYMWSIICQLNEGVCATRQGNLYKIMFSDSILYILGLVTRFSISSVFWSPFSDQQTLFRLF